MKHSKPLLIAWLSTAILLFVFFFFPLPNLGNKTLSNLLYLIFVVVLSAITFWIARTYLNFKIPVKPRRIPWQQVLWLLPLIIIGFRSQISDLIPNYTHYLPRFFTWSFDKQFDMLVKSSVAGFWEELLMRGLLLTALMIFLKDSKWKPMLAVIYSSIFFGVAHYLNTFSSSVSLNDVFQQIFYTAITGTAFAVIYLRTHTIIYGMILHFIIDFSSLIQNPEAGATTSTGGAIPWTFVILLFLPTLIAALIYLRPKKAELNSQIVDIVKLPKRDS